MHGEVREPGYVFTLAGGERGPHQNDGGVECREAWPGGVIIRRSSRLPMPCPPVMVDDA